MTLFKKSLMAIVGASCVSLGACGDSTDQKEAVAAAMQRSMQADLTTLWTASKKIQTLAPAPTGRGWDATMDAAALDAMKAAWVQAREAYEHVEGATAPIFTDLDVAIDERYDGFLADLGPDDDLFDDQGVTGLHAIERILYAPTTPAGVVAFEVTLPGYVKAAWPATEQEAASFKNVLCQRLVDDTRSLLDKWTPARIDVSGAFDGLIGLVDEQQEKVNKAATNEEESRYSQRTMADLRANLGGTTAIYGLFREWLKSKPAGADGVSGVEVDAAITKGLGDLATLYGTVPGDAIPEPPTMWSAENPKPADLETPFGKLYSAIHAAVNPAKSDSIVSHMNTGAKLLQIEGYTQ